jgi:hypothetical protein
VLSEKRNSFSGLLTNKGFKEERTTQVGLDAIDKSTTLESNTSGGIRQIFRVFFREADSPVLCAPGEGNRV